MIKNVAEGWFVQVGRIIVMTFDSAVVGEKEATNQTVNVRTRDNAVHGEKTVDVLIAHLKHLQASKSPDDKAEF